MDTICLVIALYSWKHVRCLFPSTFLVQPFWQGQCCLIPHLLLSFDPFDLLTLNKNWKIRIKSWCQAKQIFLKYTWAPLRDDSQVIVGLFWGRDTIIPPRTPLSPNSLALNQLQMRGFLRPLWFSSVSSSRVQDRELRVLLQQRFLHQVQVGILPTQRALLW